MHEYSKFIIETKDTSIIQRTVRISRKRAAPVNQ